MKAKDFFSKRYTQSKSTDEALKKLIDALPDTVEFPDELDQFTEENFMTAAKALSDKDIMSKARAEVYNIVDERITKNIIPEIKKIDGNLVIDLETERDTLKRLTMLGGAVGKASEKLKSSTTEESDKIKEYQKEQTTLLEKIKTINTDNEKKVNDLTSGFENDKKTLILDYALKNRISQLDYADEHKPLRGAIDDIVFHSLKKENHLELNDSGEFVVSIMENGIPKPKFNGNTQVTFDQVLEEKAKPYIKKNNSSESKKEKKDPPKQTHSSNTSGKLTLREINQQNAGV